MTRPSPLLRPLLARLRRNEAGAALVEFALVLPLMLVLFGVIIEGGRMMKSYQAANAGVRDAVRYLARAVPADICRVGAPALDANLADTARASVRAFADNAGGVTVGPVAVNILCITGNYRISPAPVAQVSAEVVITFPFANLFALVGGRLGTVTTTVADESRVFGT